MITLPNFESGKGPVSMFNLVKFKDREYYFETYIPAFEQACAELGLEGVRVYMVNDVVANILGSEDDDWDAFVIVEYPDANDFKKVAESEAYHRIAEPHRLAALSDLKLFMTRRSEP
ncbi:DUF1330 domain-containing protein [Flavobacterium sp.]|uniref:DUF1330 domain-containing protein n=1 Tax=Flavobacterium sp. TaxID=239 RepID=UPI0011FA5D13|nr:DUF1330 domain-containing protein [Flavobacterium sp.]RZJ73079.1 MAG: DUF1330 domain-containing protein [Flavobacterium sp.]